MTTVRNYRHGLLLLKVMYFITSVYVVIVPTPYPFLFNIVLVICAHVYGYAHCRNAVDVLYITVVLVLFFSLNLFT